MHRAKDVAMTPQEQQLISGLIDRVQNTRLSEKDPDAEQTLNQGLGRNPDAIYILAQTVLVQQFALEQAQRQLAEARAAQQQQPKKATSFLGSIFGSHDEEPTAPPPTPAYRPVPGSQQPATYAGEQPQGAPAYSPQYAPQTGSQYGAPPQYGSGFGGGQSGGFLRGALQTATGVAAGALAFEGVESLLHGFGSGGGSRGFGDLGGGGNHPEEVVNNYYGDSSRDSGLSPDIEDRRGDSDTAADDRFTATADDTDTGSGDDQLSDNDSTFDDGSGDSFDGGLDDSSSDLGGGSDDSSFS